MWSDAKTPGEEAEPSFRTAVGVTRCVETVAETPGKNGKSSWIGDNRRLQAELYIIPLARLRKYSAKKPVEKAK